MHAMLGSSANLSPLSRGSRWPVAHSESTWMSIFHSFASSIACISQVIWASVHSLRANFYCNVLHMEQIHARAVQSVAKLQYSQSFRPPAEPRPLWMRYGRTKEFGIPLKEKKSAWPTIEDLLFYLSLDLFCFFLQFSFIIFHFSRFPLFCPSCQLLSFFHSSFVFQFCFPSVLWKFPKKVDFFMCKAIFGHQSKESPTKKHIFHVFSLV